MTGHGRDSQAGIPSRSHKAPRLPLVSPALPLHSCWLPALMTPSVCSLPPSAWPIPTGARRAVQQHAARLAQQVGAEELRVHHGCDDVACDLEGRKRGRQGSRQAGRVSSGSAAGETHPAPKPSSQLSTAASKRMPPRLAAVSTPQPQAPAPSPGSNPSPRLQPPTQAPHHSHPQ
jgi:hypothetical protein